MIFQKLLTNGEIILIVTITLCTVVLGNNATENDTDKMAVLKNHTASTNHSTESYYIIPSHYNAVIRINYETYDFIGECNVTIHINRQTDHIIVEPITFVIFKIVLYGNHNEKYYISYLLDDWKKLIINFTNPSKFLLPGRYNLIIAYMRYINNSKKHFFETPINSLDTTLVATGIDILTARQLFPIVCSTILCWNEENFTATFNISIKHHRNYAVLSNMPSKTTDKHDKQNNMWTYFDVSPIMSFKHLIVVITSFSSSSAGNFTIWGRESSIESLLLAKCIVEQVLYFLQHENNIIKVSKLDYIAFWDNHHNTSETSGLILSREADILFDEDLNTLRYKMQVSYFITNQIVSLWYADALLWSKTGFVSLLSTYIFHQIASFHDIMTWFYTEIQLESFRYNIPSNLEKINVLSHFLNYAKSLNTWRMLYQMVPDVFWTGIRTYVEQQYNQTNVVNTSDLWNITQTVIHMYSDNDIVVILNKLIPTWREEKYYPTLYVTRNFLTKVTTFSYLTFDDDEDEQNYHPIFVTYTTRSIMNFDQILHNKSFWLSPDASERLSENFDKNDWIIVNLHQQGYYRVNYETENWLQLAEYMNSTNLIFIPVVNRAQMIDDAFHFLISKQIDYVMFWKICAFLSYDTNYVVWYPMFKMFEYITTKVFIEDSKDITNRMQQLMNQVLQTLGYDEKQYESDFVQFLREEIMKWACIAGSKECRTRAYEEMMADLSKERSIKLLQRRQWMYCNGLKIANRNDWSRVRQRWISTSDNKFLDYLICSEDINIIIAYLEMLMQPDFLKLSNTTRVNIFLLIIAKHIKHDQIYNFVLKNFDTYILSFTSNKQTVKVAILIIFMTHQKDVQQLKKVIEFAKTNLKDMQIVDAIKKKERHIILIYKEQVANYGLGLNIKK